MVSRRKETEPALDFSEPGGHVQWSEHDISSIKLSATEPQLKQSAMAYVLELMQKGLESR